MTQADSQTPGLGTRWTPPPTEMQMGMQGRSCLGRWRWLVMMPGDDSLLPARLFSDSSLDSDPSLGSMCFVGSCSGQLDSVSVLVGSESLNSTLPAVMSSEMGMQPQVAQLT